MTSLKKPIIRHVKIYSFIVGVIVLVFSSNALLHAQCSGQDIPKSETKAERPQDGSLGCAGGCGVGQSDLLLAQADPNWSAYGESAAGPSGSSQNKQPYPYTPYQDKNKPHPYGESVRDSGVKSVYGTSSLTPGGNKLIKGITLNNQSGSNLSVQLTTGAGQTQSASIGNNNQQSISITPAECVTLNVQGEGGADQNVQTGYGQNLMQAPIMPIQPQHQVKKSGGGERKLKEGHSEGDGCPVNHPNHVQIVGGETQYAGPSTHELGASYLNQVQQGWLAPNVSYQSVAAGTAMMASVINVTETFCASQLTSTTLMLAPGVHILFDIAAAATDNRPCKCHDLEGCGCTRDRSPACATGIEMWSKPDKSDIHMIWRCDWRKGRAPPPDEPAIVDDDDDDTPPPTRERKEPCDCGAENCTCEKKGECNGPRVCGAGGCQGYDCQCGVICPKTGCSSDGTKNCKGEGCQGEDCSCPESCKGFDFRCDGDTKSCKETGCQAENCTCKDVCYYEDYPCGGVKKNCREDGCGAPNCDCGHYCANDQPCDGADSCQDEGCQGDGCTCPTSCADPEASFYNFRCGNAILVRCADKGCEKEGCDCKAYCPDVESPPCNGECVEEEECECGGEQCSCEKDNDCGGTKPCKCENGSGCGDQGCQPLCKDVLVDYSTCGGANTECKCRISQANPSGCGICTGAKCPNKGEFRPCGSAGATGAAARCTCGCGFNDCVCTAGECGSQSRTVGCRCKRYYDIPFLLEQAPVLSCTCPDLQICASSEVDNEGMHSYMPCGGRGNCSQIGCGDGISCIGPSVIGAGGYDAATMCQPLCKATPVPDSALSCGGAEKCDCRARQPGYGGGAKCVKCDDICKKHYRGRSRCGDVIKMCDCLDGLYCGACEDFGNSCGRNVGSNCQRKALGQCR